MSFTYASGILKPHKNVESKLQLNHHCTLSLAAIEIFSRVFYIVEMDEELSYHNMKS